MKTKIIQGLAVVGFIAILFVGLWGTVQVVKLAPSTFSNLAAVVSFKSVFVPNEEITINTPSSLIPSDTEFELTWEHVGKPENGTYTFNYACKNGLTLATYNEEGVRETIQCDSPFSFSSDTNSLPLIPISKESRIVYVPIVITSVNESGESVTLTDSSIAIINKAIQEDSSTNTGSENPLTAGERTDEVFPISSSRSVSDPNGRVDLSVRIIGTGIVDANGNFIPSSSISVTEKRGAVQFSVTNQGSRASDTWTFNAVLPTMPMHIFHSTNQKALQPGDRIDFTLGFDQLNRSLTEGVITINADPSGNIGNELSRDNNIAQTTFKITQ
ncbi:hypothetical protein ACFL6I_05515 [candidate division KSB1 bacterium]